MLSCNALKSLSAAPPPPSFLWCGQNPEPLRPNAIWRWKLPQYTGYKKQLYLRNMQIYLLFSKELDTQRNEMKLGLGKVCNAMRRRAAGKLKSLSASLKSILPRERRRSSPDAAAKAEELRRASTDSRVRFAEEDAQGAAKP